MTNKTNNTEPRPLATFCLFSYNQEKFIKQAVESAFAQTYEPLEIILSDDHSSDNTFEILQTIAASYSGPHKVYCIKQKHNLGTVNHIIEVARRARGNLIVIAAGDDISNPNRVEVLIKEWQKTKASALCSFHDEISEDGTVLRQECSFPPSPDTERLLSKSQTAIRINGLIQSIPGFCAAYEKSFWASLPYSSEKLLVEDGLATILLNIRGEKIHRVKQSLISYRIRTSSLSVRTVHSTVEKIRMREKKISVLGEDIRKMVDYILGRLDETDCKFNRHVIIELKKHKNYGETIQGFWEDSHRGRIHRLCLARSWRSIRFLLPRILGFSFFVTLRKIATCRRRI